MLITVSNECQPPTFTALLVKKSQCAVSNVSLEFHRVWGFLNQNLYILLCNTCLPVRTFHKKKRNRGRVLTGIYLSYIVDVKNNIFPLSWGHNVVSGRNHNFYFKIFKLVLLPDNSRFRELSDSGLCKNQAYWLDFITSQYF